MGNQTGVARPGSSRGVGERGDGFLNTRGRTSAPCPEQLPGWRCSNEPLRKEGAGRRGPGARLGPGLGFALLSPWCPVVPRGRRRGSVQTALRVAVGESGPHPAPPTPAASPQAWQPLGVTLRARARGAGGGAGHWNSHQPTCSCRAWLRKPVLAQAASSILAVQGDPAAESLRFQCQQREGVGSAQL